MHLENQVNSREISVKRYAHSPTLPSHLNFSRRISMYFFKIINVNLCQSMQYIIFQNLLMYFEGNQYDS